MKKVAYISGSRADYSPIKRTLLELNKRVDLTIIATCMHLSPEFGLTIKEIERDGFKIQKAEMIHEEDTLVSMVKSFGRGVSGITDAIGDISPDLILVEGDRGESLAGAIIGAHMNIPVIHHGGGDIGGSIDNKIRYGITMFADYHLVGNEDSYKRLSEMGIPEDRLFNVGEPGLDDIYKSDFTKKEKIIEEYGIDAENPLILLVQHPNTEEYSDVKEQITETMEAIRELNIQTIAIYSNSDAGGRQINQTLEDYASDLGFLKVYPHIERMDFLGLMNVCEVMVGNSSAGIMELPSFKKPFVNIGTRQKNRLRAGNTIDVGYNREEIVAGIRKGISDSDFRDILNTIKNPYGDGRSCLMIIELILQVLEGEL